MTGPLGEQVPESDVDRAEHAQQCAAAAQEQQVTEEQFPALLDRERAAALKTWCEQLLDAGLQPQAAGVAGVRVADPAGATLVDDADDHVFAALDASSGEGGRR